VAGLPFSVRRDELATPALSPGDRVSNRGTKVWPDPNPDTYWSDHWSCRFESDGSELFTAQHVVQLLDAADRAGFDVIKTEGLYTFNGERGYSLAQGE